MFLNEVQKEMVTLHSRYPWVRIDSRYQKNQCDTNDSFHSPLVGCCSIGRVSNPRVSNTILSFFHHTSEPRLENLHITLFSLYFFVILRKKVEIEISRISRKKKPLIETHCSVFSFLFAYYSRGPCLFLFSFPDTCETG